MVKRNDVTMLHLSSHESSRAISSSNCNRVRITRNFFEMNLNQVMTWWNRINSCHKSVESLGITGLRTGVTKQTC